MKRRALLITALITILTTATGFVLSRRTRVMELKINAKDLSEHGLIIIRPSDPSFDSLAADFFKDFSSEEVENLKPFSILIKNETDRTVVSQTVIWELTKTDGKKISLTKMSANSEALTDGQDYFDALARTNMDDTIRPNSIQLFSLLPLSRSGGGGGPFQQANPDNTEKIERLRSMRTELATKYTEITVSIDGAFFDDGAFVGPDINGLFDKVQAQVKAKRDLVLGLAKKIELKMDIEEVFQEAESKAGTDTVPDLNSTPADEYNYFSKFFANQFRQLRKFYGDNKIFAHILRSARKPEPKLRKK
jgi:uncharacterized protein (UPF0335 family)